MQSDDRWRKAIDDVNDGLRIGIKQRHIGALGGIDRRFYQWIVKHR
jgi:hypothetical protein